MQEAVNAVLIDRARDPDGLRRMVGVSVAAHAVLLAALVLAPNAFGVRADRDDLENVMTISLGGASGPRAGGLTPLGGRPIQEVARLPEARRPPPVRAPAAEEPSMTLPDPQARRAPTPRTAPADARGRTPTQEAQAEPGSAVAETGGRGMGFGLSTGGGGTAGYLDVGNFCCPQYLSTMLDLIRRHWDPRQPVPGEVLVRFVIQRDGRLTDVALERSSGYVALDLAAQRAIISARQIPQLPTAFPEDSLTVHLNFQYQR